MRLGTLFLANFAQERGGLLDVVTAFWDTVTIQPGQPVGWKGFLVVRLLADRSECNRAHNIEIRLEDADGGQISSTQISATPALSPNLPHGWDVPFTVILQNAGSPLPSFGEYRFVVLADNLFLAHLQFRVVEAPPPATPQLAEGQPEPET